MQSAMFRFIEQSTELRLDGSSREAILGTIGSGAVVAIGVEVPDAAAGARGSELNVPGWILITAVTRFGQTEVAEPHLILQEGDFLNLVVMRAELGKLPDHLANRGKALRA